VTFALILACILMFRISWAWSSEEYRLGAPRKASLGSKLFHS
jgi:hypothetical protein